MSVDIVLLVILLAALIAAAFAAVVVRTLPVATVLLALTSVALAIDLYLVGMGLAAVIELSVSAGLVTAILASAIALLKPTAVASGGRSGSSAADSSASGTLKLTGKKKAGRLARYAPLPIIMLVLAALVIYFTSGMDIDLSGLAGIDETVFAQTLLWDERVLDILGLAFLILAGVLGVALLVRRSKEK